MWGGHPGFQDMQAAAPPAKAGSAQATLVHMRVCPLVSAALCRLLTQATGKVTVKSLLYPGPGDAPLPDSGHPCGWPCWAQCRPSVDTVDGLKRQAGRHMAAGQGSASPCSHPRACGPSPSNPASLCPHHPHALPRPCWAPLCHSPHHAEAEHCWSQEGSWTAGERVSG